MIARRHACFALTAIAALSLASTAHAGSPTRIQLVAELPNVALAVIDDSGDIVGEIDGIATDALVGTGPGAVITGARLHLSIPGTSFPLTWGHVDGAGDFVAGLPGTGRDGSYAEPFPGATLERLYTPPIELDITGPSNASERSIELAVQIAQTPDCHIVMSKPLLLVKPPLVLVHGIGGSPSAWTAFSAELDGNRGFRSYAVDHSGGSYSSGFPTYGGNGDIHASYEFVRGGKAGSVGVAEALASFRAGDASAHSGQKIVVQKVDIVASSYGGLLSRWYVEQATDYADDVRKLITMGTPHRGSPLANMDAAALSDPVIAAADSQFFSPILSMAGSLQLIDDFGFIRWKDGGMPEAIVPALEVMTVDSEVLGVLNDVAPFSDDVAYGSIVGTDDSIDFLLIPILNGFYDLEPTAGLLTAQKSYFPWMRIFDAGSGDSDAIVPTWSQTLPARSSNVPFDHVSYHDSTTVQNTVSIWLQDSTLPRGDAHRPAFLAQVIPDLPSRDNAYVGSTLIGDDSVGGGLVQDAIVQVKFSGPTLGMSGGLPELDSMGGIVTATMTGMARVDTGALQLETLILVEDDVFDTTLDVVASNIDPGSTPVGQLFTFSIDARVGRDQSASILGPDGSLSNFFGGEIWSVGYEISGHPDFDQSPWTNIDYPSFALPTIFVPGESEPFVVGTAPGSPFTAEGGVHANAGGGGTQMVNSELWEDNFFWSDTLLEDRTFSVSLPANTFSGALMPYSEPGYFLFKNGSGDVEGASGNSSGETNATVYQHLQQTGGYSNQSSSNVDVNVAP